MTTNPVDWTQDPTIDPELEYRALLRSLRRNQGFGLFFVQCSPAEGDRLIQRVQTDLPKTAIEVLKLDTAIDNLYDVIEALPNKDPLEILFIQGLELSLYAYEQEKLWTDSEDRYGYSEGSVPKLLAHLNLSRERFQQQFPFSCVFLVPLLALKYLMRRAPDFFDWRSGVMEFIGDPDRVQQESLRLWREGGYNQYCDWTQLERNQKILAIQALLEEPHQTLERKRDLLFDQALLFQASNQHEAAIASYDRALELNPDNDATWRLRGNALANLGRYEEAIASYDRALELKPDYDTAWYNRGNALFNLGRYEDAIASYDRALELKPDQDAAWNNRGNALSDLGRYEAAIASYNRALELKPDDTAWNNRGLALANLGRYEEAIASYDRALEIKPDDDIAWYNKACCYALWGKLDQSIKHLHRAITLNPECREKAKTDTDFDGIRQDERFRALVEAEHGE